MDLVSVIIPTYNRAHLIGQTIQSLLQQTYSNIEIIVVDDHSNDETTAILKKRFASQIRILKNNGVGPGAARNTGFSASSGRFIKFFDSDDVMTINSIEAQVSSLKITCKNYVTTPYFYGRYYNGQWISIDSTILNYYSFPSTRSLTEWMIRGLFITIPSMLFCRDFLQDVEPWATEPYTSEDWSFLWNVSLKEPFPAHTNQCAFIYRIHEQQSTGNNFSTYQKDIAKYGQLLNIYQRDFIEGKKFSLVDKVLFKNQFYQMAAVNSDEEFRSQLLTIAGSYQRFVWMLRRLQLSIGRMKTNSIWQPMHGVITGKHEIVRSYISALHAQ